MEFINISKKRFSCRNYKNTEVDKDLILNILEAARIAPSACNIQPWHFVIETNKNDKIKLLEIYHRDWFLTAPVRIYICGNKNDAWIRKSDNKNHLDIDLSIAIDHITLQATDLGLATCWVCNFNHEAGKKYLELPENFEITAILTLGFPNEIPIENRHESQRKKMEEIVHWEKF